MCDISSMCVVWPQWVWFGLSGCDIASVGVTWCQLVWHGLSRCNMASVGVSMASVFVSMPLCV